MRMMKYESEADAVADFETTGEFFGHQYTLRQPASMRLRIKILLATWRKALNSRPRRNTSRKA